MLISRAWPGNPLTADVSHTTAICGVVCVSAGQITHLQIAHVREEHMGALIT